MDNELVPLLARWQEQLKKYLDNIMYLLQEKEKEYLQVMTMIEMTGSDEIENTVIDGCSGLLDEVPMVHENKEKENE